MRDRVVMASKFKEQCLTLLDQVETMKVSVVVTKRGRPVARLVPLDEDQTPRPIMGSVTLLDDDDAAYFSTGEDWEAQK